MNNTLVEHSSWLPNNVNVKDARDFAIKVHGTQMYSGNRPYIYHLDQVVENLHNYGIYPQIIGYLHDVVEDTNVTTEEIITKFGVYVGTCVDFLTDNKTLPKRKEKKEAFYKKMKTVDENHKVVLIVKAADRLANVSNGEKLQMYKREHTKFKEAVYRPGLCDDIWNKINKIMEPGLKKFYMKSNIIFKAKNIDGAFEKIREHFGVKEEDLLC